MEGYTIDLHEFLYLICNASDRIEQIKQNHVARKATKTKKIKHWEVSSKQKIHLLPDEAF